jgi:rhodanese-related sulfurtransferase
MSTNKWSRHRRNPDTIGMLRKRLDEMPQDRDAEIVCYCKNPCAATRRPLWRRAAWKNVKVMEGGIMAWPFPREK